MPKKFHSVRKKKVIDVPLGRVSPLNLLKKAFKREVWSREKERPFGFLLISSNISLRDRNILKLLIPMSDQVRILLTISIRYQPDK